MRWFLVASAAAILFCYGITISIYRLYFHPLSKYPGPKLAALTNWYASYFAWRGDLHLKTRAWHEQYGEIVRSGPNLIWFNSRSAVQDIYGTRANVRKADAWVAFSASRRSPNTLSAIDKQVHAFKRRTLATAFSDKGLKLLEDRILRNVDIFTSVLDPCDDASLGDKEWGSPKLMSHLSTWLTFDIIGEITYAKSFDLLRSPKLRWIPSVYNHMSRRGMMCIMQPKIWQYKLDRIFLAPLYRQIISAGTWVYEQAKARACLSDNEGSDVFTIMMGAKDRKRSMEYSLKDMWTESMLLLAAGADTTATTMSAAFFYLLHDPVALSRVVDEVRSIFADEDEIRPGSQLNACTFLQACIHETFRLIPAVPNASPRQVLPGGLMVGDQYIPEGTIVASSLYAVMRKPEYFFRPDEFYPARWIADSATGISSDDVQAAQKMHCSFGVGPRSCPGWKLASLELALVIAKTVFQYDMRLQPGLKCCASNITGKPCEFHFIGWSVALPGQGVATQFRRKQADDDNHPQPHISA